MRSQVGVPNANNTFQFNTVQLPILANNIAIYGGEDNSILGNALFDTVIDGGGMHVAPQASIDDGFFDGVVIQGGGLSFWARHGLKLYSGGLVDVAGVRVVRCKSLRAEPVDQRPVFIDLDGEQPGTLPATWTVVPASLDLLV